MINNNEEFIKVLKQSEKEAILLKNEYVGTEHLLLGILNSDNNLKNILYQNNLTYFNCKKEINNLSTIKKHSNNIVIYTPLLKRLIMNIPNSSNNPLEDLFLIFLEEGEGIGYSILNSLNINIKKIYNSIINKEININYGVCLNDILDNNRIIGRDKEINLIIETLLRKNKTNPLLIGKAGTGKTAIIEELAYKIKHKQVPKQLYNKKIISINISSLVSGTKYRGEFEEKLNNLISEVENDKNIILFIDEIHTLIGAGGAEGAIDASNILKPYLARNNISCIGATTISEYNNSIKKDKALNRRFNKIIINEPSYEETLNILINTKKYYEKFHNVKINNNQVKLLLELSTKYIKDKAEPDKTLEILDTICTKTKLKYDKNDNDLLIKDLYDKKRKCLLDKKYNDAIKLNIDINHLIKKNNIIKISNESIIEYFSNYNNKTNFGFKF